MSQGLFYEDFNGGSPDRRLSWLNPPGQWSIQDSSLIIEPEAGTDYWARTHYGFIADNGPFLNLEVEGDFTLSTQVRFYPVHQYDQAGLMVRISAGHWIKTCVEYEPEGPSWLGVVVTNFGYSDWSTQAFRSKTNQIALRVLNQGSDYTVQYLDPLSGGEWTQIRIAHLFNPDKEPIKAGLFACSPKGKGFKAEFQYLSVENA